MKKQKAGAGGANWVLPHILCGKTDTSGSGEDREASPPLQATPHLLCCGALFDNLRQLDSRKGKKEAGTKMATRRKWRGRDAGNKIHGRWGRLALTWFAYLGLVAVLTAVALNESARWTGTWTASPSAVRAGSAEQQTLSWKQQTIREIVHTSIAGKAVRIRLSNTFGDRPLTVAAAHIALRGQGSATVPGSDRTLRFGGGASVWISAGSPVLSDPVDFDVPEGADLAVSLYFAESAAASSVHYSALQTSYVFAGDVAAETSPAGGSVILSWPFLTAVDVSRGDGAVAIVAFGDSITDGSRSTADTNRRWPNFLAQRLAAHRPGIAVLNSGIGGNRVLHDAPDDRPQFGPNALARFDRDVLAQAGVKYVIVLLGINDIGQPGAGAPEAQEVSADQIIAGLEQIAQRAREKRLQVFAGTLTPFEGTGGGYYTPAKELKRQAVNQWIRSSKVFDGFIDFDKAVRDPAHGGRFLPLYDSGDHLHPNDEGSKAMGNAIDLALFRD
jgi:lysophospholipase L1-like esterase